jgi:putative membrane protein
MASIVTLAFLHHAAAFLVFAVLTVELVLMRGELTAGTARSLLRMDALYGIAATVLLVVGLLRVFYTEKGAAYYFHSGTFIAKLTLFIVVALLSIYPTVKFMAWRKALKNNQPPALDAGTRRKIRMILHFELMLLVVIILLAVMMARGIGFIG